jgi:DHA1 family bicyclomycin/chloramphenicol resistance-like MFS transporter
MILFALGSMGCAIAGSANQMIAWRVLQALGACSGPVLARAMVRDLYTRDRSAQMLSTLMLIMGVAPLLGPIVGAQIMEFWSWRAIFWALAVFGVATLLAILALPETLAPERRSRQRLTQVWSGYVTLARNPHLLGYAAAGGFYYCGAYAFIAGTPFAYIDFYHVPDQLYGFLFGINIVGMMGANFLNSRLVMHLGADRIFRFGTALAAVSGIVTALDAYFGWGGLYGLVIPLFFYFCASGMIVANSVASALAAFPQAAGAASALVGAGHYGSGILSAAMLGWFADGTPWTMGWIIGLMGICSLASTLPLALRRRAR